MARTRGEQPEQDEAPEAAEVALIEAAVAAVQPLLGSARGDARDAMLGVIRASSDWGKYDEQRQRDINAAVNFAAETLVTKLARIIAAEGKQTVNLTLDQLTVKGGLKVVCSGSFTHDALQLLGEAQGKAVVLTVVDTQALQGQRNDAPVVEDQGSLLSSETDDLAEAGDAVANAAIDAGLAEHARANA